MGCSFSFNSFSFNSLRIYLLEIQAKAVALLHKKLGKKSPPNK